METSIGQDEYWTNRGFGQRREEVMRIVDAFLDLSSDDLRLLSERELAWIEYNAPTRGVLDDFLFLELHRDAPHESGSPEPG